MKTPNHNFRNRLKAARRRGLSLIETAMVLAVLSLLLVFFVSLTQTETDRLRAKNTADKLATVGSAAKAYMSANYASLLASAPTSGAKVIKVGRTSSGGSVPNDSLQDEGFLPPSFIDANSYQQNTALLVRKVNSTTLEAMLTTYGGQDIPDRQLGNMANLIGPEGGYVPARYAVSADNGDVVGVGGGWRTKASEWGAAETRPSTGTLQMTMMFEDGELLKDYLYRNDVGIPEANRMNTSIDVNGNNLNNVDRITGANKTVYIGASSTDPSSLEVTRDIFAGRNLEVTGNAQVKGDARVVGNLRGGSIDSDTTITAKTNITAGGSITANGDITGQNVTARANLRANGNLNVDGNTFLGQNADYDTTVRGDLNANRINIDTKVFGADVGGGSRDFGADVTLGDMLPRMVTQYSYLVRDGQAIYKPTCRGGFSKARVMVYRQVDSTKSPINVPLTEKVNETSGFLTDVEVDTNNAYSAIATGVVATDNGSTWTIKWVGDPVAPNTTRQALAQTFCYYG